MSPFLRKQCCYDQKKTKQNNVKRFQRLQSSPSKTTALWLKSNLTGPNEMQNINWMDKRTFIWHVFCEKRVCDFRESTAHYCATSADYSICKKHRSSITEEKHPLGALKCLVFAGSGGHYLGPSKNVITLDVFLNLTTVFLRKSSNSISIEAPVRGGMLRSEPILLLPCQDVKSTSQCSNMTF